MNDRYKWIALSNTTLAILLATLDLSITLIAMPDIFRGIKLDPLQASNSFYLLWMILGYMIVGSVLIVSLGRFGDMYGRVRIYNLGFVIYTAASLLLAVDWLTGPLGADYLIGFRIVQGIGGACLMANAAAIITDAFPQHQRGMALGINNIVGVSGMFIGLVLGGLLAPISWRLVFLISVPVGLFGTVWAYLKLREIGVHKRSKVDWWGNITFALGLILLMVAITYGIRPAGGHSTGWMSARVLILVGASVALLTAFAVIERRASDPMFRLPLFRIRAFSFGTLSTFLSAIARGGLMFMLIIWLQGIWLPEHGYNFTDTPLWAGIYILPLTVGMLISGPTSGYLSDRFGARWFASGGMVACAVSFALLLLLPIDFPYPAVRRHPRLQRDRDGDVRLPQPRGGDEQPAPGRPRRRRGHEPDLPELRPGDLGGDLLLADGDRAVRHPAPHALQRPDRPRGPRRRRLERLPPAPDLGPVRRLPRLQPDPAPARRPRAGRAERPLPGAPHRPRLLPPADLQAVPQRPRQRVRVLDRGLPGGGRGVVPARGPLPRQGRGARPGARARGTGAARRRRASPSRRSSASSPDQLSL